MLLTDSLIVIGISVASLGTIHEEDGVQEQTFWLRNVGESAVALKQGYTSCGCTTISYEKNAVVEPNDSTAITLRFNPRGKGGDFYESGTVVYGKKSVTLALTGNCITSEETLMKQFPIRVTDNIRLSTNRFDLGIMHTGETKERKVVALYKNKGNLREQIPVRFTVDAKLTKGLHHIPFPIKLGAKKETITLDVLVK